MANSRSPGGRHGQHGSHASHPRQNVKPKHDRRDEESEAIDAEELFSDDVDEAEPTKKEPVKKLTKAAAAKLKAAEKAAEKAADKAEKASIKAAVAEGRTIAPDNVEEGDDEGSVLDIDEGGSELPGNAPDAFFDNNENSRDRDRDRGGDGRRRRRRGRRGRGRDGEGEQTGEPRAAQPPHQGRPPHGGAPQDRKQGTPHPRDQRRPNLGPVGTLHGKPAMTKPIPRNDQEQDRDVSQEPPREKEPAPLGDYSADLQDDGDPQPLDNRSDRGRDNEQGGRRRRRRGGRGRGRGQNGGGGGTGPKQTFDRTGLPDDEELDREAAALEAARLAEIARKENPRGESGRGGSGRDESDASPGNERSSPPPAAPHQRPARNAHLNDDSPGNSRPARQQAPRRVPPPIPPVVKTGSADKHLVDDEPVDHVPVSRPRSRRDLDELPDFED